MAKNNQVTGANLGFEDKLWAAADKLRGNMDAAEYKHVVLGLIFLKYISDAFLEKWNWLKSAMDDPDSYYVVPLDRKNRQRLVHNVLEDLHEYLADNIFWVPPEPLVCIVEHCNANCKSVHN